MTRPNGRLAPLAALFALSAHVACGDVTSELITDPAGASATGGTSLGGSATGGTTGGSAPGGAPPAGSSSGGSNTGGSSSGGGAGSGGTPMCTTSDDCSGSERNICRASDGVCVECTEEGQCDPEEDCSQRMGECAMPCASDADCTEDDDAYCDTAIGFCAECVDDVHCPMGELCGNWQCHEA